MALSQANITHSVTQQTAQHKAAAPVSGKIYQAVADASEKTGVSFSYLLAKANTESAFDPNATSKSSTATGMYQFIERTWLDMVDKHGAEHGLEEMAQAITKKSDGSFHIDGGKEMRKKILDLRKDPAVSSLMAAEYAGENKDYLTNHLKRDVSDTDLYLAHFLGAGGANKFLSALKSSPKASAADLLPEAAAANHSVFYGKGGREKSVQEIYASFTKKMTADTYYALSNSGDAFVPGAMDSDAASIQTASAISNTPSAQGAIPNAQRPYLTSYLLAALDAPGDVDRALATGEDREGKNTRSSPLTKANASEVAGLFSAPENQKGSLLGIFA